MQRILYSCHKINYFLKLFSKTKVFAHFLKALYQIYFKPMFGINSSWKLFAYKFYMNSSVIEYSVEWLLRLAWEEYDISWKEAAFEGRALPG
jgi:hypothetical protein